MSNKVTNALLCVTAVLSVAAVCTLYAVGARRQTGLECRGVEVTVRDSAVNRFVSGNDVKRILTAAYGSFKGVFADSLDLGAMESLIEGKSVIRNCESYVTRDGTLNVEVTQRTPAVRFQDASNGWYADEDGYVFPLQRSHTSMVPVVDGDFPVTVPRGFKGQVENPEQREWLMRVVGMVGYMNDNGWGNRISQIHVSRNGEVKLIPVEGDERFVFGQPVKIRGKFAKMEKYYRMIRPLKKGYGEIDLRFDGQIVCRQGHIPEI